MKGINAVHENDVAVARCYTVVQQRLTKAEEEHMKVLIHQTNLRQSIDLLRRELVCLAN